MDIQPISHKTLELKYFDSAIKSKLHDAGFIFVEDLVYRGTEDIARQMGPYLNEDEQNISFAEIIPYATLLRIRSIDEDKAKSIQNAYINISSLPYISEDQLSSTTGITYESTLRIQRDSAIFLKSGKAVIKCTDKTGSSLANVTISIAYPTDESANRFYTFFPNESGDIYIENVSYGSHDLYIQHEENTYKHRINISDSSIRRETLTLNEFCQINPIDEFVDGKSDLIFPSTVTPVKLSDIRDGESFRIIKINGDKVTLLANFRIQNACSWLLRTITLAASSFNYSPTLFEDWFYIDGQWSKQTQA